MAPDPDIELRRMIGSYLRQCRRDAKVSLTALVRRAPWACKIVKVCGGYMAFESVSDYEIWRAQK